MTGGRAGTAALDAHREPDRGCYGRIAHGPGRRETVAVSMGRRGSGADRSYCLRQSAAPHPGGSTDGRGIKPTW